MSSYFLDKSMFEKILFLLLFLTSSVFGSEIYDRLSSKKTFRDLDQISLHLEILKNIDKKNTLTFRGAGKENFFTSYADAVVAVFTENGSGSGVVINDKAHVVTNWHVVEDFSEVDVVFKPPVGSKAVPSSIHRSRVLAVDKNRDLALIEPLYPPSNFLQLDFPEDFEFTEEYLVSKEAHCIGHPSGYNWTYTKGIISQIRAQDQWSYYTDELLAENLSVSEIESEKDKSIWHIADVIQIDCSISPGNSGGPLLNEKGEILGINSNGIDGILLNFAIAANEVQTFLSGDIVDPITVKEFEEITLEPVILDEIDLDGDGIIDTTIFDMNGNLLPDTYFINEDNNMTTGVDGVDYVLIDDDENDLPETQIYWVDDVMYEEYDIEQDGIFDVLMIDYDDDGNYDEISRI